ncbi:PTS system beta-glucosides-specific IIC component [Clostridium beijerinckii]|uniref:beta-glucoside-specific PTS transporter subunit IIABC n=1 Tax=Clostridium beijerinckii TaxID=1520 RepID=UPI00156F117D|nr:beta-glucoside-specific PTS transporter subunit IIABC [Clostridium beijerinckii]NRT36464.1 PTS system beta-glucosides-specific IIC component [Clostridium beijerinckii]NRT44105.1 PTS system beta-glucosides-specific IIC component [Clostridium beijerinckii]NRZ21901.1 PTS system beta-glucosides-specific IIC component [Clostridium beijerinckii]
MSYKEVAAKILKAVGGDENVEHLEHCSTRLRFNLIDNSKVKIKDLESIPEVIAVKQNVQCQIIIGNAVVEVYDEVKKLISDKEKSTNNNKEKRKVGAIILDFVISVFQPLIPAIAGGGILKSLLMLLNMLGILSNTTSTYKILNFVGDAPLYFLPLLVAFTTANKMKVNPLVAVSAVAALLTPNLAKMLGDGTLFFNIPVQNINYAYQVFPAILCVLLYSQLEKFFNKISPKVIRSFFVPMMSLLITVPVTLLLLGPIGYNFGQGFAAVILFVFGKFGWLAVAILAAFLPFMVVTGMHKAMIPYVVTSLSQSGRELIYNAASLAHNISEAGGCFAVSIRTKDKGLRSTAVSAGISALFGITEPALYGVTILHKRVLYGVMIGSFIGGAFLGIQAVEAYVAVGPGIASLSMFISETLPNNLMNAVIGLGISFVASFIAVTVLWKEQAPSNKEEVKIESKEEVKIENKKEEFNAPLEGELIPLSEVKDDVFSNKLIGEGFAIIPSIGELYAPIDGTIEMVFETKHSLAMKSEDGTEILFHVGLETVNLKGKYFNPEVSVGKSVKQGDLLLSFDLDKIIAEGFDPVTSVIITNRPDAKIETIESKKVNKSDKVFTIN